MYGKEDEFEQFFDKMLKKEKSSRFLDLAIAFVEMAIGVPPARHVPADRKITVYKQNPIMLISANSNWRGRTEYVSPKASLVVQKFKEVVKAAQEAGESPIPGGGKGLAGDWHPSAAEEWKEMSVEDQCAVVRQSLVDLIIAEGGDPKNSIAGNAYTTPCKHIFKLQKRGLIG